MFMTMWQIGEEAVVGDEHSAYYLHTVRIVEIHSDILLVEYNGKVTFAVHEENLLECAR